MEEPNLLTEEKERILDRLDYLIEVLREMESIKYISEAGWNNTIELVKDIERMIESL